MAKFSKVSLNKLKDCHPDLQRIFNEVIKHFDCSVLEGYRARQQQDYLFCLGKSKLKFPNSKHNTKPSMAVDVVPYPIDWQDRDCFHFFAGFVFAVATKLDIKIRWGGNWAMDLDVGFKENRFDDLCHFELVDESAGRK